MQRPILFNGTNYYICRPPELVKEFMNFFEKNKVVEGVGFEPT